MTCLKIASRKVAYNFIKAILKKVLHTSLMVTKLFYIHVDFLYFKKKVPISTPISTMGRGQALDLDALTLCPSAQMMVVGTSDQGGGLLTCVRHVLTT